NVQDLAPGDTGRLNRWALDFVTSDSTVNGPILLKEAPGTSIPDNTPGGLQRVLTASSPARVDTVEVAVNISHTWISDLRVSLQSPAGTEVVLHANAGGSYHDLVQTYTSATAPALAILAGQPAGGAWRLRVVD